MAFYVTLTMSSKKGDGKVSSEKKKRMMSIEMKQEIIDKHERGVRVSDLVKQYNRSSSTICTILKQKDAIKAIKPTKGVTILSKMRTDIHDEMERLLLLWIRDKELAGDTDRHGEHRLREGAVHHLQGPTT